MGRKSFLIEIFLVSLAGILLEVSYTRIFSFKLYYYFTYLILGIALLGLGAGGVFVALIPRLRKVAPERLVTLCCLGAAAVTPLGYLQTALTQVNPIDLSHSVVEVLKLIFTSLVLFSPFLLIGIVIATILGSRPGSVSRLYFADLVGAGIGCGVSVPLFLTLTPPGAVVCAGLVLAICALVSARGVWRAAFWASAVATAIGVVLVVEAGFLPDPVPARTKTLSPQRSARSPILSSWGSVFRVDVMGAFGDSHMLVHDGTAGSAVHQFDGDLASVRRMDTNIRAKPFSLLEPGPKVLIIGAAGGHEILASLALGAGSITAIELNPVTVSLLRNELAEFSGHISDHPRVRLVNAEGRSFLQQDEGRYDLIWFVAPDSYAAMNAASSGAFVLSESYLYTVEMMEVALAHLSENGIMCAQFGESDFAKRPNRTLRYLATAREAFARRGVSDFSRHVLLSTGRGFFPSSTIILKREPLTPSDLDRFRAKVGEVEEARIWYPAAGARSSAAAHLTQQMIEMSASELEAWHGAHPYRVDPITDDSPFFWHFSRFRDVWNQSWSRSRDIPDFEHVTGERTLLILLGIAIVFAGVFLLLPLLAAREVWGRIPHKGQAFVYFAGLGLGFMFFEVCLIQKLALFLGYPTYSLTVTLFSLLVFSGIGSLLSERYAALGRAPVGALVAILLVLTLFYQFGLGVLEASFGGAALLVRVLATVVVLAPLGLCLGAFMPIGLGAIASLTEHREEYIAWAWAVNGFFSVVSSVLATILAMAFGFKLVLMLAMTVYLAAGAAFSRLPADARRPG